MTPQKAKRKLADFLDKNNLEYSRLSAKTVGFSDLARGSGVFVTIHGWRPSPKWEEVKQFAHSNGFCIEAA